MSKGLFFFGFLALGTVAVQSSRIARDLEYSSPTLDDDSDSYPSPPSYDPKHVQQWINFAFIYSFAKYPNPSPEEAYAATEIYAQVKDASYSETPISSNISQNITLTQMKALVNKAYTSRLISKGEHAAQLALLNSTAHAPKFLKTIREHVLLTGDGEIVYGLTGLLQLSRKLHGGVVRGTLINSFRKFKLTTPLSRGQLRYSRGRECILWETFCKIAVSRFGSLDRALIPGVLTYMRAETLAQFKERYESVIARTGWEAYKVLEYLPDGAKSYVGSALAAGEQRPDEVLSESQLHGHLYDF